MPVMEQQQKRQRDSGPDFLITAVRVLLMQIPTYRLVQNTSVNANITYIGDLKSVLDKAKYVSVIAKCF